LLLVNQAWPDEVCMFLIEGLFNLRFAFCSPAVLARRN
jgi:hypothetical protein